MKLRKLILYGATLLYPILLFFFDVPAQARLSFVNNDLEYIYSLYQLHNRERVKRGLPPLRFDERLQASALDKAVDMLKKQYWDHLYEGSPPPWELAKQSGVRFSRFGENLARGFISPNIVMRAWLNSPGHRRNILNPEFNAVGIARVQGTFLGRYQDIVVVHFATIPDPISDFIISLVPPRLAYGSIKLPGYTPNGFRLFDINASDPPKIAGDLALLGESFIYVGNKVMPELYDVVVRLPSYNLVVRSYTKPQDGGAAQFLFLYPLALAFLWLINALVHFKRRDTPHIIEGLFGIGIVALFTVMYLLRGTV